MVWLYGIRTEKLPGSQELAQRLDPCFLDAWKAHHPRMREEQARRVSLGGLFLLAFSGARGELAYTDEGRPFLKDSALDFSITHTGRYVLCAVARPDPTVLDGACPPCGEAARVGLDAEDLSRLSGARAEAMAKRWLSEGEQAQFAEEPTPLCFLRLWTRKEALGKWLGQGLRSISELDTANAVSVYGVRFCEYPAEGTAITLCLRDVQPPPTEVYWLSETDVTAFFATTC